MTSSNASGIKTIREKQLERIDVLLSDHEDELNDFELTFMRSVHHQRIRFEDRELSPKQLVVLEKTERKIDGTNTR